jgi:hydroxymethylbilane synthase
MTTPARRVLRLGARGSLLSRMQSEAVARAVEAFHHAADPAAPALRVELVPVTTTGDRIQDRPLHAFGGKGLFTKELELALLRGEVDFAVHSMKDVPVTMPLVDVADLVIAAVPPREDPRDLLVSALARDLRGLPAGSRVGTGSLRRQAQVLALRPDLRVVPIRGNVDTRLRKLRDGEFDAVLLAVAGVRRAGLFDPALMTPIDAEVLLPSAGQGALALQCRRDDAAVRALLAPLADARVTRAVALERDVVRLLNGDCHSPIAALATVTDAQVRLDAAVGAAGGQPPVVRASVTVPLAEADTAPRRVVEQLR